MKSDKGSEWDWKSTAEFELFFKNPCEDAAFINMTPTAQTSPEADNYSGDAITFEYNPFKVEPSYCDAQVSCRSVQGPSDALSCQELEDGKLTWLFNPQDVVDQNLLPGEYTYTYDVTVGPVTESFEVTLTLVDPCESPQIVEPIAPQMEYTVTDNEKIYYLEREFSMTPSICEYNYAGLRKLDDKVASFVEFNELEGYFKIGSYSESLDVVGDYQFEIVYKAKNFAGKTVVTSYSPTKLSVLDPCENKDFVRIEHTDEMDTLAYTVGSGPEQYVHAPFTVVTEPIQHDLCGPLVQVGSFNGEPVDG